jgi:Dolichyl-phosphate-mannose-protein mannosyltransferase
MKRYYGQRLINLRDRLRTGKPGTLFLLASVLVLLLHGWSLMRYPAPYVDEAWLVSRAWGFIQTGHAYGILDSSLVMQYDHYWILNQWLITALHSLLLRFFPTPVLMPLRIFSLVIGIGLLAANYAIARRLLGGRRWAAISTLLLATSLAFFHSAHLVRYDILASALGYTALAVVLMDRKGRFIHGLIAGLLTGLAVETHPNSLIYVSAIGIFYLIEYGWKVWRKGTIWGYARGWLAGLIYYLSLHYFPSPETYRTVNQLLFGQTQRPPLITGSPAIMAQGLAETGNLLLVSAGPMVLLALLAIPRLITRKTKEDILLLALNLVMIITAGLLIPNKTGHYAIYLAPAFLLLVTSFLSESFRRPWSGNVRDYVERIVVWGAIAGAIALSLAAVSTNQYDVYLKDQAKINTAIQPRDVIMGSQVYWFGLVDHPYLSWEELFLYPRLHPGATIADAFQYFKPDVFIIDPSIQTLISDQVDPSSRWYYYHLPEKELMDYLDHNATLVLDGKDESNLPIRIYRIKQ